MSSSSTHPSSPGDDACRRLPRLSRLPVDGHTVSDETAVTTDEARAKLLPRRRLLRLLSALPLVAACVPRTESPPGPAATATAQTATTTAPPAQAEARTSAPTLTPTPECREPGGATVAQTAGPFFKPSSPARASLVEAGMSGVRLIVGGVVLTRSCRAVAGALLDFWQADANGVYDNAGFRLRGHQFAAADGRYRLETIVPAQYASRTPHIHVKVQAPNRPVLTTQLYFPGEPRNATDLIFSPRLVIKLDKSTPAWTGTFDFVLDIA